MRFATFNHQGRRQLGLIAPDGRTVTALDLPAAAADRGMLAMIELLAAGGKLPATTGAALPLESVKLEAPIHGRRRQNF